MRRGIVMAEGRGNLIVLTPEGEFVEVPGQTGTVGEEIAFGPLRRRTALHRRLLLTASAAAVLLLAAVGIARLPVFDGPQVAAYVAIDINPSVEIGVDKHRSVVELQALNEDGERVIEGVAYRKRPVGEVAADIIRNAEAAEYLRDGGEVFVTSMTSADISGRFEEDLMHEIDQAVHAAAALGTAASPGPDIANPGTEGPPARTGTTGERSETDAASGAGISVTIVRAPGELRETAQANGVSPGKMAVYLLAERQGLPISLDDLKAGSIRQAVEPFGGIVGVLGDGRSDEERKRELAEMLEKEKAKTAKAQAKSADAKNRRASSGNGEKTAAGGARKAPAEVGNKASAVADRKDKQTSRRNERPGKPDSPADKAGNNRKTAELPAWLAANRPEWPAAGRKQSEIVPSSARKADQRQTEAGKERDDGASGRHADRNLPVWLQRGTASHAVEPDGREADRSLREQKHHAQDRNRQQAQDRPQDRKNEPQRTKEQEQGNLREQSNRQEQPKRQDLQTPQDRQTRQGHNDRQTGQSRREEEKRQESKAQQHRQTVNDGQIRGQDRKDRQEQQRQNHGQQQRQEQERKQQEKQRQERQQQRMGNDDKPRDGQPSPGRQDGSPDRRRDERRTGQDVRTAGFARFSADGVMPAGTAGPDFLQA